MAPERADRILEIAAGLLLKWGYKRVTIEDIARQAAISVGTIYLHWSSKEKLFECVLLREILAVWTALLQATERDAREVLLHRIMQTLYLMIHTRPLAKALFIRDSEILGKLVSSSWTPTGNPPIQGGAFIVFLRELGLLREEFSPETQAFALNASRMDFFWLMHRRSFNFP